MTELTGRCPEWCRTRHDTGLPHAHSRVCVELSTRHGEVYVQLEQSGGWPPLVALSVDTPGAAPPAVGYLQLGLEQVRQLRDALSTAVDLLQQPPDQGVAPDPAPV